MGELFSASAFLDGVSQLVEYAALDLEQRRRLLESRDLAIKNDADGVIVEGRMFGLGETYNIVGAVYFDRKQRFLDGTVIGTSAVEPGQRSTIRLSGDLYVVNTRNSRYVVQFAPGQDMDLV